MIAGGSSAAAFQTAGPFEFDPPAAARRGEAEGTVLAFDFGLRRIGVAVGDTSLGIAHPLETVSFEDNRRRFEAIAALVEEWRPALFVVGHPVTADGAPHPLEPALQRFERRLAARFGLPIERVDETLSSWDASRRLSASSAPSRGQKPHGAPARGQKERIDAMAASVILETWFEQRRRRPSGRGACA